MGRTFYFQGIVVDSKLLYLHVVINIRYEYIIKA